MATLEQYERAAAIWRGQAMPGPAPVAGPAPVVAPAAPRVDAGTVPDIWAAPASAQAPATPGALVPPPPEPDRSRSPADDRSRTPAPEAPPAASSPSLEPTPLRGRTVDKLGTLGQDYARAAQVQQQAARDATARLDELVRERGGLTKAELERGKQAEADQGAADKAYQKTRAENEKRLADLDAEIAKNAEPKDRRTDGQRMMAILAMAFAGIGDAGMRLGGGQSNFANDTLAIIQGQIDRDIDRQREALSNKRKDREAAREAYAMAREAYGDDNAARRYADISAKERYATAIGDIAARVQDSDRRAQLKSLEGALLADVTKQRQSLVMDEDQARARAAAAAAQRNAAKLKGPDWSAMTIEQLQAAKAARLLDGNGEDVLAAKLTKQGVLDEKSARVRSRAVPGFENTKPLEEITDEDSRKVKEASTMFSNLKTNLRRMKELATSDWGPTARESFDLLREKTIAMTTQASGSGVPGATEAEKLARAMPGPNVFTTWSLSDRAAIYDSALKNTDDQLRNSVEPYGYRVTAPRDQNRQLEQELGAIELGR